MKSLEVCWLVYRNISVDSHEDNDVDRTCHERVDEGKLKMGLEECREIMSSSNTSRDIKESRNSTDEDTEIGDSETEEVDIHDAF